MPTKPAGGWRSPMSEMPTPYWVHRADRAIPFEEAACCTAFQVAFTAWASATVSSAHAYVPSPRSNKIENRTEEPSAIPERPGTTARQSKAAPKRARIPAVNRT